MRSASDVHDLQSIASFDAVLRSKAQCNLHSRQASPKTRMDIVCFLDIDETHIGGVNSRAVVSASCKHHRPTLRLTFIPLVTAK